MLNIYYTLSQMLTLLICLHKMSVRLILIYLPSGSLLKARACVLACYVQSTKIGSISEDILAGIV